MFNKNYVASLVATAGLLFFSTGANAITLTLDTYNKTVVQPTTGAVQVDFTGTVTLTEGYSFGVASASSLWNADGDISYGMFAYSTFNMTGVIFSLYFDATDIGLYAFDSSLEDLAYFTLSECPTTGGGCNNASVNYSVNVVKSVPPVTSVPEPTSLALFGIGVLGLAFAARKSLRA